MPKMKKNTTDTNDDFEARPPKPVRAKVCRYGGYDRFVTKPSNRQNLKIVSMVNGTFLRNTCGISSNVKYLTVEAMIIDRFAFYNRKNLVRVRLSHVEEIGDYAFGNCRRLKLISITNSLRNIGANIFAGCEKILIRYSGTKEDWNKIIKHPNWANRCKSLVVSCLDGDIKYNK